MPIKLILFITFLLLLSSQKTLAQQSKEVEPRGAYFGIGYGVWLHQDHNGAPNPNVFTTSQIVKSGIYSYGIVVDYVFNSSNEPLKIEYGNQLVNVTHYSGGQITLEFGNEMWRKNRLLLESVCGAGFGGFIYFKAANNDEVSKSSFVLNPGLSLKYLLGSKGFVELRAQYNLANYKLNDVVSTDFHGNYFTLKLIVGSIGR